MKRSDWQKRDNWGGGHYQRNAYILYWIKYPQHPCSANSLLSFTIPSSALHIRRSKSFWPGKYNWATGQQNCACQATYQITTKPVSLHFPSSTQQFTAPESFSPEARSIRRPPQSPWTCVRGRYRQKLYHSSTYRALGLPGLSLSDFQHTL